jgi:hypothetical protein
LAKPVAWDDHKQGLQPLVKSNFLKKTTYHQFVPSSSLQGGVGFCGLDGDNRFDGGFGAFSFCF